MNTFILSCVGYYWVLNIGLCILIAEIKDRWVGFPYKMMDASDFFYVPYVYITCIPE